MPNILQLLWQSSLLIKLSLVAHLLMLIVVIVAPDTWPCLLMIFLFNHLILASVGLWPRSNWLGPNWTHLPAAAIQRNEIALTIDDGPDPIVTPEVLNILDDYAAKATFFCIGNKVLKQPELCREIVRRGHTVENHSQQHRHNFSLLGIKGFSLEIEAAQQTLLTTTGRKPRFFRAPAGLRNPLLQPVLSRLGLTLASWSVRAFDTRVNDAEKVSSKLIAGLHPGAIVLLHDGNAARTKANVPIILAVLPAILQAAKQKQLRFVTLQDATL